MKTCAISILSICSLFLGCSKPQEPVSVLLTYQPVKNYSPNGTESDEGWSEAALKRLTEVVSDRLSYPKTLAEVSLTDDGKLEVGVYGAHPSKTERVKRLLALSGTLEFRITANHEDHEELIEKALESDSRLVETEDFKGRWVKVSDPDILAISQGYVVRSDRKPNSGDEILVVLDEQNVTGVYLNKVIRGVDSRTGTSCLNFGFDKAGAARFGQLTGMNLPNMATGHRRNLGIILNGTLVSAPSINSVITDSGQITGNFTPEEVDEMISVFDSGSLPFSVKLVDEQRVEQ